MYVQDTITKRQLDVQSGYSWRLVQRTRRRQPSRSRAWAFPTTSRRPTRFSAFPTRARWRLRSTRTWCWPPTGCNYPVIAALVPCIPGGHWTPGFRNEFHAGFQQAFGRFLVIDGEYIWKYTHNAYDFSVLGSTPITFPINWHNSKIPGWALRASVPVYHGFSALVVMSSVAARFFPPQVGGLGRNRGTERHPLPHRPRRSLQHDRAPAIPDSVEARAVDRLQLAL